MEIEEKELDKKRLGSRAMFIKISEMFYMPQIAYQKRGNVIVLRHLSHR